jgi:RHS repeat-associated protein
MKKRLLKYPHGEDYPKREQLYNQMYADARVIDPEALFYVCPFPENPSFIAPGMQSGLPDFFHTDHLGSSSWVTDVNGNPLQHLQYMPFGEPWVSQTSNSYEGAKYTFSGKERDKETGLMYFGARYYNPGRGIFTQVDPLHAKYPYQSPFVYCANNPLKYVDPNGKEYDDYFNQYGKYLGTDCSSTDKVKIIKQETWDKVGGNISFKGNDGTTVINQDAANFISQDASQSGISDQASLSIYEHYNTTGCDLTSGNGNYNMQTQSSGDKIAVNIEKNKVDKISDHFNEIKNVFVHEKQHVNDIRSGKSRNLTENQMEQRAIKTQMNHPTYSNTRKEGFQDAVIRYGKKHGMIFD